MGPNQWMRAGTDSSTSSDGRPRRVPSTLPVGASTWTHGTNTFRRCACSFPFVDPPPLPGKDASMNEKWPLPSGIESLLSGSRWRRRVRESLPYGSSHRSSCNEPWMFCTFSFPSVFLPPTSGECHSTSVTRPFAFGKVSLLRGRRHFSSGTVRFPPGKEHLHRGAVSFARGSEQVRRRTRCSTSFSRRFSSSIETFPPGECSLTSSECSFPRGKGAGPPGNEKVVSGKEAMPDSIDEVLDEKVTFPRVIEHLHDGREKLPGRRESLLDVDESLLERREQLPEIPCTIPEEKWSEPRGIARVIEEEEKMPRGDRPSTEGKEKEPRVCETPLEEKGALRRGGCRVKGEGAPSESITTSPTASPSSPGPTR